jgi:hypothetical protein
MTRRTLTWLVSLGVLALAALNGQGPWPPM